ncbi:MAG: serine--tRNA ligase [Candidatus Nitrosoabyssus spongiisocia]|nr:MAG: serine--tRNA ligase [Nitrosopumilaceae archaeon AB1(1)]
MLDPSIIRDKPDKIRQMLTDRNIEFDLQKLITADKRRRELIQTVGDLRKEKNQIALDISERKKSGQDTSESITKLQKLNQELDRIEKEEVVNNKTYNTLVYAIPNLIHESVPIGADDTANMEIKKWGKPRTDKPADHVDMAVNSGWVDLVRAAKISGARFYFLKGDLVLLNQAIIKYSLDFLQGRQYTPIQPPYMINRNSMEGAVIAEDFEDVIYKIQEEDLYLIGTSEHAMAAMHADEILEGKELPLRYAGTSPCFRKEAGAHGRDQKGIFRVHQFDKIEQFVFSRPEDSWKEHERMLQIVEDFYQSLELPYRVVLLSSGDMGKISAKTYDLEAWMAGQDAYREVVSCSNCLEYQARRLKIRFRDKSNEDTQYLHTLNGTLAATSRLLVAILENFQTKDKHIDIPQVLQKYMNKKQI